MIIKHANDVESTIDNSSYEFGIDENSQDILIRGFSDNLYSNKIGSIVREITSNCFDAHAELGVDEDVHITIKDPDLLTGEIGKISFRDFGIGLSPERVQKTLSKYFASTKRTTNNQIGGFGIGAKSPLSYTDSFEIITIIDQIEYHYVISKGAKRPIINLLSQNKTDEKRGTEVIIPIKNHKDLLSFKKELKEQLKYFDNIKYFNCDISNEYNIIKGNHFILRTEDSDTGKLPPDGLKLCIGKVAYPIDFNQLNISMYDYSSDFAVRFEIGDIDVTMSRESIEYTERTKDKITEKLELFIEELTNLKMVQLAEEEDLITYLIKLKSFRYATFLDKIYKLPSKSLVKSNSKWSFKPLEHFKYIKCDHNLLNHFIGIRAFVTSSGTITKRSQVINKPILTIFDTLDKKHPEIYRIKTSLSNKKIGYIQDKLCDTSFYLTDLIEEDIDYAFDVMANKKALMDNKDAFIKEYRELRKYVIKYFISITKSYDRIEIDEEWEKEYKEKRNSLKNNFSQITLRISNCTGFHLNKMKVSELSKRFYKDQLLIYGFSGEDAELLRVHREFTYWVNYASVQPFTAFKISRANAKYLKEFTHAYHWDNIPIEIRNKYKNRSKVLLDINNYLNDPKIYNLLDSPLCKSILPEVVLNIFKNDLKAFGSRTRNRTCPKNMMVSVDELGYPYLWNIKTGTNYTKLFEDFLKYLQDNPALSDIFSIQIQVDYPGFNFLFKVIKQNFKPFKPSLI